MQRAKKALGAKKSNAFTATKLQLLGLYQSLLDAHGPQHWWPADTAFEVMIGAVLTQNTAWSNVEKAIAALRVDGELTIERLSAMEQSELARHIRPAGYFNVKAKRLRHLFDFLNHPTHTALSHWPTNKLRTALLQIHGIGPETADDILLYAFSRPVFVIDAYTRRLLTRMGLLADAKIDYEQLRANIEAVLPADVELFNQFHALIVRHAKHCCTSRRPSCMGCVAHSQCERVGVKLPA